VSRYEQVQLRMGVTNYSKPHQLDVLSVYITTYSSTLRKEVSSSRYLAESEFYILRTKVNGVRIQMCYFVRVSGIGSSTTQNGTFSGDNSEGENRVKFVSAYVRIYIYIYIYIYTMC
jgi:hypothetical protein